MPNPHASAHAASAAARVKGRMRQSHNLAAHYWLVGNVNADPPETRTVYSSAARATIADDETGYVAWLAAGGVPSTIISTAELIDVLTARGIALPL